MPTKELSTFLTCVIDDPLGTYICVGLVEKITLLDINVIMDLTFGGLIDILVSISWNDMSCSWVVSSMMVPNVNKGLVAKSEHEGFWGKLSSMVRLVVFNGT